MDNAPVLKVTDIKQYLYCPRITYYTYVLPVAKKTTAKMNIGKEEHLRFARLEGRRTVRAYALDTGHRVFGAYLFSPRLGLEGVLDMYIITPRGYVPVDFKNACRIGVNHKYQLVAYALLLEDKFDHPVRFGFVYLMPLKKTCRVEITPEARLYTRRLLGAIRHLIAQERFPLLPRRRGRCADCEYRNYCGDVK